jgi:serine/threonine protein kinase
MFEEAAVLSRLRHPCIVTFWGVVVVEDSKAKPAAARSSFPKSRHDSAGSYGSRGRVAIRSSSSGSSSSSRSQLSLGLVLECCDESLESVLRKEPLLPLPEALHVAERIACGLKYLHTDAPLRVVHGDLKPANVLLTERFDTLSVQLTDFGLSSTVAVHTMSMGAKNLVARNAGGQPGATLAWAAPELLEAWAQGHSAPSTFAADVYAFGLILHQLLMGCWPYEGMLLAEDALKAAIRGGRRPGWVGWEEVRGKEAEPDVLSRLKALVEACWAQEATKRPTAQKVHTQLVELKREVVVG